MGEETRNHSSKLCCASHGYTNTKHNTTKPMAACDQPSTPILRSPFQKSIRVRNPSKKSCCKPTVNSNSCATTNSITVTQNSSSDREVSTTTAKYATKPIRYWLGISAAKCNGTNWDFLQLSWIPNDFPKIEIPLSSCIHIASNAMPLGASDLPPDPPPPKA